MSHLLFYSLIYLTVVTNDAPKQLEFSATNTIIIPENTALSKYNSHIDISEIYICLFMNKFWQVSYMYQVFMDNAVNYLQGFCYFHLVSCFTIMCKCCIMVSVIVRRQQSYKIMVIKLCIHAVVNFIVIKPITILRKN